MKIAHEAPIAILKQVQKVTHYEYVLVHLLDESQEYKDHFYSKSKIPVNQLILDNSIFELGHAFDWDKYAVHVQGLNPTRYILPDVLGDKEDSIHNARVWMSTYHDKFNRSPHNLLPMAAVQGQSMDELTECYVAYYKNGIRNIAIGFNHDFFVKDSETRDWDQANGRIQFVKHLKETGVWKSDCYHHLLGCSLPIELGYRGYNDINSVDTSSPILHGLLGIKYDALGLYQKKKIKMNDLIHSEVSDEQLQIILDNIKTFRYITE